MFFTFFRSMEKWAPDGPKWAQEDFVLLIQTLPTFWATRILILRIFIFWIFVGSQFFPVWKSGNLGTNKIPKMKILKIKIRAAQNVGKVRISRKKSSWPHLGPSGPIFCVGQKNAKNENSQNQNPFSPKCRQGLDE